MERHAEGSCRVIPVILRPCDWHGTPFGKLLAVPRDGKAITTWTNFDEAFLDVTTAIRNTIQQSLSKNSKPTLPPIAAI